MSAHPRFPDASLALVDRFVAETPIDEATVWLEANDGEHLEAIYNPVNDKLPGLRQPLSRGLISQAFATGLPLLEREVSLRSGHDRGIDTATGTPTRSLLAAPITTGDTIVGIVSAVRLAGCNHDRELSGHDLDSLGALAARLGRVLEQSPDNPAQGA